jgi:hypothetical protein
MGLSHVLEGPALYCWSYAFTLPQAIALALLLRIFIAVQVDIPSFLSISLPSVGRHAPIHLNQTSVMVGDRPSSKHYHVVLW